MKKEIPPFSDYLRAQKDYTILTDIYNQLDAVNDKIQGWNSDVDSLSGDVELIIETESGEFISAYNVLDKLKDEVSKAMDKSQKEAIRLSKVVKY